jgi:hypothetical protein
MIDIGKNEKPIKFCCRCQSPLDFRGFCLDDFCGFSKHKQECPMGWVGHPDYINKKLECSCGTFFAGL